MKKAFPLGILMLFLLSIVMPPITAQGDAKYEYCDSGTYENQLYMTTTASWEAQTFTIGTVGTNENFTLTKVVVKLTKESNGCAGYVNLSIRNTSGGVPVGPDLVSQIVPVTSIPLSPSRAWITFTFDTGIVLNKGCEYAIVFRYPGHSQWRVGWRYFHTPPPYPGGQMLVSSNSGSTWGSLVYDATFEIWGMQYPNYAPNSPVLLSPENNSDYESVYSYLNVTVTDPNGNSMDTSYYWGNGTFIGSLGDIINDTSSSLFLLDYILLNHDETYYWYVNVSDGEFVTVGDVWNFHTSKAWDLNEDRTVNYLDVSSLVSHYGEIVSPQGYEPWDINNDGDTNYLDVSSLVSHYGEIY